MKPKRLDEILEQRGSVRGSKEAFIVVTEGRVFVNGQRAVSPGQPVAPISRIEVRGGRMHVGRGALKLLAALEKFDVNVQGSVCLDIGSATGGFVEVLLDEGAKKVYALDTAKGKLDPKLRDDPRVSVMEGVNVLYLESLPERADLVTIDVSLTSLRHVLAQVRKFLKPVGSVVALFKPQYEVKKRFLKHGVVRDSTARTEALEDFIAWVEEQDWKVRGKIESPIRGSKGNIEYLLHLKPL